MGGGSIFLGKSLAPLNWLNDVDPYIYSFFKVVKESPIQFCQYIQSRGTPTVSKWIELKESNIENESLIERAYKLLFFNRSNYSGIFTSNPLGGLKQESEWKIDCRWNENLICKRIIEASTKLEYAEITNIDFQTMITTPGENVLLMLDPPYYEKGHQLYPFSMQKEDHERLAELLRNTDHKFLLTIDDCTEVREIYYDHRFTFINESWKYTVNSNKNNNEGKELFITNIDKDILTKDIFLTEQVR